MYLRIDPERKLFDRDPMLYGHFLEHFHRQIYGGVYQPGSPLADEEGFRTDVIEALRGIETPIIRWPGGCYVSAYHWKNGVGERVPSFDKAWRVEETNEFGTDEFVALCKKIGCEPYICTNAGSGTPEEMSDWVEYCNLPTEGQYAKMRIAGGHTEPYNVRYWSVGNENYFPDEIGSKTYGEWGRFVCESAKMMKRVDPGIELSAAAIADVNWNTKLIGEAGDRLSWISIHGYWDGLWQKNEPANYTQCMAKTVDLDRDVRRVRGLLAAFGLEKRIRIAYDEWNLRGWHHPAVNDAPLGDTAFIEARALADLNETYTMADAVFSACFLNMLLRNADVVGMANFAPIVNTRGAVYTYDEGIVLRSTYHVFHMYTKLMGDQVIDSYLPEIPEEEMADRDGNVFSVPLVDIVATKRSADGMVAVSLVNKHPEKTVEIALACPAGYAFDTMTTLSGESADDYNDVDRNTVVPFENKAAVRTSGDAVDVAIPAHSVNVLVLKKI